MLNAVIRALTLGGRLLLLGYLARFMDFQGVGMFALMSAITAAAPSVLSFGLHYGMYRTLISASSLEYGRRLRDRFLIYLASYSALTVVAIAAYASLDASRWLPGQLFVATLAITCLESALNELHQLFVNLAKPVEANVILFVRSSAWVLPYIAASQYSPEYLTLPSLSAFWIGGQISALALTVFYIRDWPWTAIASHPTDIRWFARNLRTSAGLYTADLGLYLGQYADRLIIASLSNAYTLGIYALMSGIANAMHQIAHSGVNQVKAPLILQAAKEKSFDELRRLISVSERSVLALAATGSLVIMIAVPYLAVLVQRPTLTQYTALLGCLLFGSALKLVSDVKSYALYALSQDKALMLINIATPLFSAAVLAAGLALWGDDAIAVAFVLSAMTSLSVRWITLDRCMAAGRPQKR